jgi:hypothetical protein
MTNRKSKFENIRNNIFRGSFLNVLVSSPVLIALGIILVSRGSLSPQKLGLCFFIAGFTGLIVVIRKESPMAIGSIRGKWAVWEGALFTAICWGLALVMWF